jgi:serine/threonine-protein kinase
MEYLEGLDLEDLIGRFGPVPAERAVHLLMQACDSLADAHEHGMTHRDIKPANLHLSRRGPGLDFVKVLDFGLVQTGERAEDSTQLTAEGTTSGTPAYMAPEMAVRRNGVDGRADIYALGCVAYWLLTGTRVFEGDTGVALIVEHVKTAPVPPSRRTEMPIPAELERIVMKCLEKDPADRFASARELAAALAAIPLPAAWNATRADQWWQLHMPPAATARSFDGGLARSA